MMNLQKTSIKKFYRINEVAEVLAVNPRTVYRIIDDGVLPALRIRGCLRIPVDGLDGYIRRLREDQYIDENF